MEPAERRSDPVPPDPRAAETSPLHPLTEPQARPRPAWTAVAAAWWRELAAAALMVAGVVLVLAAWNGAAHSQLFVDQIPYLISGGLLGLALIVVAAILGAASLQERALRELRRELAGLVGGGERIPAPAGGGEPERVYVLEGGRSFHVAGCPVVEGKEGVRELAPAQASRAGYAACKLCGPGG